MMQIKKEAAPGVVGRKANRCQCGAPYEPKKYTHCPCCGTDLSLHATFDTYIEGADE